MAGSYLQGMDVRKIGNTQKRGICCIVNRTGPVPFMDNRGFNSNRFKKTKRSGHRVCMLWSWQPSYVEAQPSVEQIPLPTGLPEYIHIYIFVNLYLRISVSIYFSIYVTLLYLRCTPTATPKSSAKEAERTGYERQLYVPFAEITIVCIIGDAVCESTSLEANMR